MKLNLRFLYLLPLLAILLTDEGLKQLLYGNTDDGQSVEVLYLFGVTALNIGLTLWCYRYMAPLMRLWFWVVLACLVGLGLESYAVWGVWAKYLHVFSKLTMLMPVFGLYAFYRRFGLPPFRGVVILILGATVLCLALYHQNALTVGSFLDNDRAFSVTTAYMLLPAALLCLNWYLTRGSLLSGFLFLATLGLIGFLQHRTVWVCTALALGLDLGLLALRVPQARQMGRRLSMLVGCSLLLGMSSGLAVVLDNPDVLRKLSHSIDDIQNPTTQGTGTFRVKQYEAYMPRVWERPLAGWRLQGFEMPIQLFVTDSSEPVWPDFTGHHFHSFYLDRLFYFGILGVLLAVFVPVLSLARTLLGKEPLAPETAALLAFMCTFFVFAISYDWPTYLYGLLGLGLAAMAPYTVLAPPPPAPRGAGMPFEFYPTHA